MYYVRDLGKLTKCRSQNGRHTDGEVYMTLPEIK